MTHRELLWGEPWPLLLLEHADRPRPATEGDTDDGVPVLSSASDLQALRSTDSTTRI
ncbi:MAG: hypothetical protein MR609_00215 [Bacteroidales bacterium]|nr:hypothetical protein [Bacteroidales bacterium]